MPHEHRAHLLEAELDGWLTTLGMASRGQWEVPVLLYRDQTRLVDALDLLECPGLVERAQVSQMVRCSQAPERSDSHRGDAWASEWACQARRRAIQPGAQATWPRVIPQRRT
jgi:hypothetical protein